MKQLILPERAEESRRAKLIEELESATCGSLELSDKVLLACGWEQKRQPSFDPRQETSIYWASPRGSQYWNHKQPDPTRSLDDAMALVPERGDGGLYWRLFIERKPVHSGPAWVATLREHAKDGWDSIAYRAPLAVCAVALKARQR